MSSTNLLTLYEIFFKPFLSRLDRREGPRTVKNAVHRSLAYTDLGQNARARQPSLRGIGRNDITVKEIMISITFLRHSISVIIYTGVRT